MDYSSGQQKSKQRVVSERSETRDQTSFAKGLLKIGLESVNKSVHVDMSHRTRVVKTTIDEHYNMLHRYSGTQNPQRQDLE